MSMKGARRMADELGVTSRTIVLYGNRLGVGTPATDQKNAPMLYSPGEEQQIRQALAKSEHLGLGRPRKGIPTGPRQPAP